MRVSLFSSIVPTLTCRVLMATMLLVACSPSQASGTGPVEDGLGGYSAGGLTSGTGGNPQSTGGLSSQGGSSSAAGGATGGTLTTGGQPSSGGSTATGGRSPTGGSQATGGKVANGGTKSTGTGAALATGGAVATGGALATGGAVATGGALATGGTKATGGTRATGGAKSTGGALATGGAKATGGTKATGGSASSGAPTWSQLYTNYFGPGTAGDCVSCHTSNPSAQFNNATTMCSALKRAGYIGTGTASLDSLLSWFGTGGFMPANNNPAPANAVADITAWQNAGAVCP